MGTHSVQPGNTEAAILARLIESRSEMNSHVARYLLSLDFQPEDVDRMNVLAARSRSGLLSPEEQAELDSYLHVGSLLTIMQSKARLYLKTHEGPASHR